MSKRKKKPRLVRDLGRDPVHMSWQGSAWGGMSLATGLFLLHAEGIPPERYRKDYSIYVGHAAVLVHKKWARKAQRILSPLMVGSNL